MPVSKTKLLFITFMLCGCGKPKPTADSLEGQTPKVVLWSSGPVLGGNFDASGEVIVTASADGNVRRWNAKTGDLLEESGKTLQHALFAEVSPRGQVVFISADDGIVQVLNSTGASQTKIISRGATTATFSPDSEWLLTSGEDGIVRVWDSASGAPVMELTGHEDAVYSIRSGSDGKRLVAGGRNSIGSIWDLSSKSRTALVGHTNHIMEVALSPDNSTALTVSWDQTAKLWDAQTGRLLATLTGHDAFLWTGKFSPDGRKVITGGGDDTARIWKSDSGELMAIASGHESTINCLAFGPDGKVFFTGSWDGTARMWDIDTGREIAKVSNHLDRLSGVAIGAGGEYLLTTSADWTAAMWRLPAWNQKTGRGVFVW